MKGPATRIVLAVLSFVLLGGVVQSLIQANVQEWAKANGYDQLLSIYAGPAMASLAAATQSVTFLMIAVAVLSAALYSWSDYLVRRWGVVWASTPKRQLFVLNEGRRLIAMSIMFIAAAVFVCAVIWYAIDRPKSVAAEARPAFQEDVALTVAQAQIAALRRELEQSRQQVSIGPDQLAELGQLKRQSDAQQQVIERLQSQLQGRSRPVNPFPPTQAPLIERKLIRSEATALIERLIDISEYVRGFQSIPAPAEYFTLPRVNRLAWPQWQKKIAQDGVPAARKAFEDYRQQLKQFWAGLDSKLGADARFKADIERILNRPDLSDLENPINWYLGKLEILERHNITSADLIGYIVGPVEQKIGEPFLYFRQWSQLFVNVRYPAVRKEVEKFLD